jgi:hypothetical protein
MLLPPALRSPKVRIDGPWITGEGRRHGQAADNETEFYRAELSVCGSAMTGRGPG